MYHNRFNNFRLFFSFFTLNILFNTVLVHTAESAPLNLPDSPLSLSRTVNPNVMFLLDNSGSMKNIIWHDDYNPFSSTYSDWSNAGKYYDPKNPNIGISANTNNLIQGSCLFSSFVEGRKDNIFRCIKLPDPLGKNRTWYSGHYLNYLFHTYAVDNDRNGTDLTKGIIPNDYRFNVAKNVTTQLITTSNNINFCLSSFPAKINQACDKNKNKIINAINNLGLPNAFTPLAETYYEITRYFRGLSNTVVSGSPQSPISHRCQKNYIIVVTDGYPTADYSELPAANTDADDMLNTNKTLPDWDDLSPTPIVDSNSIKPTIFPAFSDGLKPTSDTMVEGDTLYLDDMALFAQQIDFRKGVISGENFDASDFPLQNIDTYTVGFAVNNQMLKDTAYYGNGLYNTANNATTLTTVLSRSLANITSKFSSASNIVSSSGFLSSDTGIYQSRYESKNWTGQLLYYKLEPVTGEVITAQGANGSQWNAADFLDLRNPQSRKIITYNGEQGIPFRYKNINPQQKIDINNQHTLNFIRGDNRCEQKNVKKPKTSCVSIFRDRKSLLGSIIHSTAIDVTEPSHFYPDVWQPGTSSMAAENCPNCEYSKFKIKNSSRKAIIYVGANDGMLHGFNAITGEEEIAYVPYSVYKNLPLLGKIPYTHKYFVDGSPNVIDVFIHGQWQSVLVAGLNKGGQAIYALNVTDPNVFSESLANKIVMWEFTDKIDSDLGYSFARPAIARLHNGRWAAIFGSGYNNTNADGNVSTTGHAYLFIVFLDAGTNGVWRQGIDYIKIDTAAGNLTTPNGMATVAVIDFNDDYIADYVYAGDLLGNMWKFDISSNNQANWKVSFKDSNGKPIPLFVATDSSSPPKPQAITTRPAVFAPRSNNGLMLTFGTGRYLDSSDTSINPTTTVNSFYGIHDLNNGLPVTTRSDASFIKQRILDEATITRNGNPTDIRFTTEFGGNKAQNWVIDLNTPASSISGERQTSNAIIRGNNVIFTTHTPSSKICSAGGSSWLMELDARDGSHPQFSVFDLNGNGMPDNVSQGIVAGLKQEGMISTPNIIVTNNQEKKYMSSSSGNINLINEKNPAGSNRRHSWRQIK